jgi:hypothetical protein
MPPKIPKFKLVPKPLSEDGADLKFQWAPEDVGTRHQLGGEPTFLQKQKWPLCPSCREEMTFYGQLDSISDEFCIADCGLIYVFLCFGCFTSHSIVHSN